jgi:hypothetical protein
MMRFDQTDASLATSEIFDPVKEAWSPGPDLPSVEPGPGLRTATFYPYHVGDFARAVLTDGTMVWGLGFANEASSGPLYEKLVLLSP